MVSIKVEELAYKLTVFFLLFQYNSTYADRCLYVGVPLDNLGISPLLVTFCCLSYRFPFSRPQHKNIETKILWMFKKNILAK